jgi:hypothetical protein
MVPQALAMAIEENVEFRKGLPTDYLNFMGIVNQDKVGRIYFGLFRKQAIFVYVIWWLC